MKIVLASEQDSIEIVDAFGKELATIKKTEITIHDPSIRCEGKSAVQPMRLQELQDKSYYFHYELNTFGQNIFGEEKTFQVYYTSGKLHFQEVELIPKNRCPVLICGQLCEEEEGHAGGHRAAL